MSFLVQPCSPFSGMTLNTCLSKNPNSCCLSNKEHKVEVAVNHEFNVYRLSYETGAEIIVGDRYELVRSACHMLWLRDRFEVLHVLD